MKNFLLPILFFTTFIVSAQNEETIEKRLLKLFSKIEDSRLTNNKDFSYESLVFYNDKFEDRLVATLAQQPQTIHYSFQKLKDAGLDITSSADKKLRIYSWDDMQGGTMRFVNNVYQMQSGKMQMIESKNDDGFINAVEILKTSTETYYLISKTFKGSSALFLQTIDIYKIDSKGNLIEAPIIKTASRITNTLSCEADYSAQANRSLDFIETDIVYVLAKKEIHLPLIQANGKITKAKIVYRFNGTFFERQADL